MAGLRIQPDGAELPPGAHYANAIARDYAARGYVEFAELLEAGYACSACHLTRPLNRVPRDEELDLERFEAIAITWRIARMAAEIGSDALIGASAQIETVLARRIAERIDVKNAFDPAAPLTVRRVEALLESNPVARTARAQLEQHGTEVILDFGLGPSRLMGVADVERNLIRVFVRNHASPEDVAATIVHESSHMHRYFRGSDRTLLDEVRARSREFLFREGRRPSGAERRALWREVRDLPEYDGLPNALCWPPLHDRPRLQLPVHARVASARSSFA